MLFIVEPRALVKGAISVTVGAVTLSFVVNPFAFIDIAVRVHKLALAIGFVALPLAFVFAAVRPQLRALAIAHSRQPLARVHSAILKREWSFGNSPVLVSLFVLVLILVIDGFPACCLHGLL